MSIVTEGFGPDAGGGGALTILSTTGIEGGIEVLLSATGILTGDALVPSKWVVVGGGVALTVVSVSIIGSLITLTTNEATDGASYTLLVPQGIVDSGTGNPCTGGFVQPFTGAGTAPILSLARSIDARQVEVYFTEAVVEAEALLPANYVITGGGGLSVFAVEKITDTIFQLTTSAQEVALLYTVTASNIHDLAGNLI